MKGLIIFGLLLGSLLLACGKDPGVAGRWSRENDIVVLELNKNKTGKVIADNLKIFQKLGRPFPADLQLQQETKCVWSLQKGNVLKIEEQGQSFRNTLLLKLDGDRLIGEDGRVLYVRKK